MSYWHAIAGEGAQLKRNRLEREIGRLKDETERANLTHTFSKLFMFLEEDLEIFARSVARVDKVIERAKATVAVTQDERGTL